MASENITGYLQLVVKSDLLNAPERIDLRRDVVTLGRGAGNSVRWDSPQMSRKHLVMEYANHNQTWKLKDLSTNGVEINGRKLKKNVFVDLKDSDLISIIPTGALQYRFVSLETPPIITLDSPQSSSEALTQQQPQQQASRSTSTVGVVSPKRKTNSGLNDPPDQDRKRQRILCNTSAHNIENEEMQMLEQEPMIDFYTAVESPSSFSPPGNSQSLFQPSMEQDDQDDDCILEEHDINVVKEKLKMYQDRIRDLELQNNKLKLEKNREVTALKNKIANAQSDCHNFKDEIYKQLLEVMENEFSCCICNEIFIQATVVDCGHTFCAHCISEWVKRKPECPNCRKHVRVQVKHVEMENFINKLHSMFSDEIKVRRGEIVEDRSREVRVAKEQKDQARSSSSRGSRNRLGAVEFSFPPDRLVDFLAELQQINDMFVPTRRTSHMGFAPNLGAAAPDVGNVPFNLSNFHPEHLIHHRAAQLGAERSRRRHTRINIRGGPHPPVLGSGVGRGNPPNIPMDVAHLPDFGIGSVDILTVD